LTLTFKKWRQDSTNQRISFLDVQAMLVITSHLKAGLEGNGA